MSEQKMSISFRVDDGVIEHNNRTVIAKNVDISRMEDRPKNKKSQSIAFLRTFNHFIGIDKSIVL